MQSKESKLKSEPIKLWSRAMFHQAKAKLQIVLALDDVSRTLFQKVRFRRVSYFLDRVSNKVLASGMDDLKRTFDLSHVSNVCDEWDVLQEAVNSDTAEKFEEALNKRMAFYDWRDD